MTILVTMRCGYCLTPYTAAYDQFCRGYGPTCQGDACDGVACPACGRKHWWTGAEMYPPLSRPTTYAEATPEQQAAYRARRAQYPQWTAEYPTDTPLDEVPT